MTRLRVWIVVAALVVGPASGCAGALRSAGRNLGAGAVEAAVARESTLAALSSRLADSAGGYIGRRLETAALAPARSTWSGLLRAARAEVDTVTLGLAQDLENDLNTALQRLLSANLALARRQGQDLARALLRAASEELTRGVDGPVGGAGERFGTRLVASLRGGLQGDLEPAVVLAMNLLADSLARKVERLDSLLSKSKTAGSFRTVLFVIAGAIVVLALVLLCRSYLKQRRALNVIIDSIDDSGTPGLKESIKTRSKSAGVGGWLADRVTAQRRRG